MKIPYAWVREFVDLRLTETLQSTPPDGGAFTENRGRISLNASF